MSERTGLLAGTRVLTFGTFIAGNTSGRLLAELGAEVVKVESRSRPEVLRIPAYAIGEPATEPSGVPNTVMYASLTRGLRNLSIELTSEEGRALIGQLVAETDIVIENFGAAVLDRWGLGYAKLLEMNPRLVLLSLSGYGRIGPRANYVAYGKTISSYTGLADSWGYTHGTLTDYLAGSAGALAAAAALSRVRENGQPAYLDMAQIDVLAPVLATLLTLPLATGRNPVLTPNRVPGSWLSGIFPSRGYDQWVAVDIENGSDWNVLCGFLDRPDLDVASRTEASAREGELGSALASWIGGCSAHTGMHHLQRAGLAAAVVQDPEDLWRDTQLRARNFVEEIFQDDVGSVTYAGSPQRWSSTPGRAALPPARLGQHTYDVLRRWLHLSDEELGALEARGTIFATE